MTLDVKTAFLYGDSRRSLYIELPVEDAMAASGDYVGLIQRSLYGARDAPQIWQDHLRDTLQEIEFVESQIKPGLFRHAERDIDLCVHVDDILVSGVLENLRWFEQMLTKKYEVESEVIGEDEELAKQGVYLGR